MKKFDLTRFMAIGGVILAGVATLMTNKATQADMKREIEDQVNKALSERN